jgi:transposase InsO family protein
MDIPIKGDNCETGGSDVNDQTTPLCSGVQYQRHTPSARIELSYCPADNSVGENRVARRLRVGGIRAKTVRKWRATTDAHRRLLVAANTLNRQCLVSAPNRG